MKSAIFLVLFMIFVYDPTTTRFGGKRVESEAKPAETPEAFLNALGDSLKGKEGIDSGLAEILKAHILKAAPAQNAVAEAKDAIVKLAGERANPRKPVVTNG